MENSQNELILRKTPRYMNNISHPELHDGSSNQKYCTQYYHLKNEPEECNVCKKVVTKFSMKQHQKGKKCQLLKVHGLIL